MIDGSDGTIVPLIDGKVIGWEEKCLVGYCQCLTEAPPTMEIEALAGVR